MPRGQIVQIGLFTALIGAICLYIAVKLA